MSEVDHTAEAQRWLCYAREDLAAAKALGEGAGGAPRQSCWLAQQAAEKALKAALVCLRIDFPRSHDLDLLRNLVPPTWQLSSQPPDLAELTQWAVEARYPGEWPDPTPADASRAIATAEQVVRTVRDDLTRHGTT